MEGPPNAVVTHQGGIHGDPVTAQAPTGLQVLGERRSGTGWHGSFGPQTTQAPDPQHTQSRPSNWTGYICRQQTVGSTAGRAEGKAADQAAGIMSGRAVGKAADQAAGIMTGRAGGRAAGKAASALLWSALGRRGRHQPEGLDEVLRAEDRSTLEPCGVPVSAHPWGLEMMRPLLLPLNQRRMATTQCTWTRPATSLWPRVASNSTP